MTLNDYQQQARSTFLLPQHPQAVLYLALGIGDEAGEVQGKIKKTIRDDDGTFTAERLEDIKKEIGDVLWYIANLSKQLGFELEDVAQLNLDKLASRAARGQLRGDGDNR